MFIRYTSIRLVCVAAAFFAAVASLAVTVDARAESLDPALVAAAEGGDTEAQFKVGDYYYKGLGGSPDHAAAYPWLLKAAEKGHTDSQMRVGYILSEGRGVEKNMKAAVDWYSKAAEKGQHAAQFNLGVIYEYGSSVPRDVARAIELYKEAAKHPTYNLPQFRIGQIYDEGLGGEVNRDKALYWFNEAAKRGHADSIMRFANLMEKGATSEHELEMALDWYKGAAKGNLENAAEGVRRVEAKLAEWRNREMTPEEKRKAEAWARHKEMETRQAAEAERRKIESSNNEPRNKAPASGTKTAMRTTNPVHERKPILGDPWPPEGPTVEYKGVKLIGSTYSNAANDQFFEAMKWAIDKIETLKPALRKYPDLIKEIRYDPPSKERKNKTVYTNIVGTYAVGPDDKFPAPIVIYQDVRFGAPLYYAINIASNGFHASNHKRRLDLAKKLQAHASGRARLSKADFTKTKKEQDALLAGMLKTNQQIVDKQQCAPLLYSFELMKVWDIEPRQIDAMSRHLATRGCF